MDKDMTQFASKGLGAALPFRKEERKELAPQISTADSICKSNPLISHPALAFLTSLISLTQEIFSALPCVKYFSTTPFF